MNDFCRYLVDWIATVADALDLSASTKHLSLSLMDFFMDEHAISQNQLKLVALGCLFIACKNWLNSKILHTLFLHNSLIFKVNFTSKRLTYPNRAVWQSVSTLQNIPTKTSCRWKRCCSSFTSGTFCNQPRPSSSITTSASLLIPATFTTVDD